MTKFAEVAISLPIDKLFQYSIPEELSSNVKIGARVFVPFGPRTTVGYVVGFSDAPEVRDVKGVMGVIDKEPILTEELLKLTKWIGENYFCSWGEAIGAVIPGGIKKGKESIGSRIKVPEIRAEDFVITDPHVLMEEQDKALKEIVECVDKGEARTFLLHGITSSGKTEVYLQAIDAILQMGKQAIMLVPEIALTPQTIERFVARFGHRVAVTHSHLTPAKRFLEWKKIKDGKADIVVGARSAIFAPMSRLGLIIIDEEHETTYKQDDVPRYHARDVAEERSRLNKCPLILGSATPSLESYYKAKRGDYKLIRLTRRVDDRLLPKVKIVDMRMDLATRKKLTIFSRVLLDAVDNALKAGKQVIIFLNRRGFSTFINCKKCGLVVKCRRCDAVMVYHFEEKKLICHYCNYHQAPPDICPKCKSGYIRYSGLGTEKVESELSHAFSHVKMARMDSDTTAKKGSHDRILSKFKSGEVKMLVGTQMIAKGLDFPQVTLVGVVSADVTLNIPDFRSSERTFNLLTQVGGRAGRGEDGGEVIVQTYAPSHYAILAAAKHDYDKFYDEEIISRKELLFPPFVSLVKVVVRARNDEMTRQAAVELAEALRAEDKDAMIAGPAPAPMARMRGYFRYNILLKGKDKVAMCAFLKKVLGSFRKPHGVLIAVDVDPISM
ncbi:MAG: primosomal protein N' [Candidatus Omnitrophica bacterium]|nr:primosomal protein N' [Candidatus Omnitrophota bacterium]MBU1808037.1 primosomal protein N' [Candidatus Omnitrophota bacterium]